MLGPFRPGDLVAQYFRDVPAGGLLLCKGDLFMAAQVRDGFGKSLSVPVQFDPKGTPEVMDALSPDDQCLSIGPGGCLQVSLIGAGCRAGKGCIGINATGEIALTVVRGPNSGFLQLAKGLVSTDEPPRYIWSDSWRLELVIGDARIPLGEHP